MSDSLNQIEKLAEMRDKGIITEDEFQSKKTKLLNDEPESTQSNSDSSSPSKEKGTDDGWPKKAYWRRIGLSAFIPIAGVIVGIVGLAQGGRKVKQGFVLLLVSLVSFAIYSAAFAGNGSSNSVAVELVKNGTLNDYPSRTFGEAVEEFFRNPEWEQIQAEDGNTYVNVSGETTFMNEPVDIVLQYRVDTEAGTFELQAFEMNGVSQNRMTYQALLSAMYE